MSKSLASYPEDQRLRIATRRLQNGIHGNRGSGFWAAKDYFDKNGLRLPGDLGKEQLLSEAVERMENGSNFSTAYRSPRDRGHQSDGPAEGNRGGKLPRREGRTSQRGSNGRRNTDRMGVRSMHGNLPRMGGGRKAPSRNAHDNKPRIVGAFA